MKAVVALLDEEHTEAVETLWGELERDFCVRDIRYRVPWPHFTFQGAESYDVDRVDARVREIAARTPSFTVRAEGLGIFCGPQTVLYVPVIRDAALNLLHARLWDALLPASEDISPYYAPDRWVAHITLAQWDVPAITLGEVVARLAERPIVWEIAVSALGLITGKGVGMAARYEQRTHWSLSG
jgi:2'-5' RNA ligase